MIILKTLDLSDNLISSVPGNIGKLNNLEILRLRNNNIKYMTIKVLDSPKLKLLDISHNSIPILPKEFIYKKGYINIIFEPQKK